MSEGGDAKAGKKGSAESVSKKDGTGGKPAAVAGKNFWNIGLAGSGFVVVIGLAMTGLSGKSLTEANRLLAYIDGYDKGEYLIVLAVLGFVSALVGAYGLAVTSQASKPNTFKRIRYLVLAFVGWGVGLVVLLLVSFWLTFSAAGSLELVFKAGFTASLVKYSKENKIKASIDGLQRQLECCGNYNHTEWLTVSWSDAASKSESAVPQSCCDRATVAAQRVKCINSVPFGETLTLTVYRTGCVHAIVKYYAAILNILSAMMVGMAILEGAVVVIVVMEIQRSGAAGKEAAAAEKSETKQLLAKKTGGAATEKEKKEKKGSDENLEDKPKPTAPAAPTAAAAPMPGAVQFPPGYGAFPGAYGAPGVPGVPGAPYNMYYGAQ